MKINLYVIFFAALLTFVPQARARWDFDSHNNRLTDEQWFSASSPAISFDSYYRAYIFYGCNPNSFSSWLGIGFGDLAPVIDFDDYSDNFDYELIKMRTVFFSKGERQNKTLDFYSKVGSSGSLYYDKEGSQDANGLDELLSDLATSDTYLVGLPLYGQGEEHLEFSLSGSANAINRAREACGLSNIIE